MQESDNLLNALRFCLHACFCPPLPFIKAAATPNLLHLFKRHPDRKTDVVFHSQSDSVHGNVAEST